MNLIETPLAGAFVIQPDLRRDERGFFARTFCRETLREHGIDVDIVQCNLSQNRRRGTLRGMHYQVPPHAEQKLVCCLRGAAYDVIVDLRADSQTYGCWHAVELTAANRRTLFIPRGMAHGFQTLTADTELFYQMGHPYSPQHARGFCHDDPAIGIEWPLPVRCISERDQSFGPVLDRQIQYETTAATHAVAETMERSYDG
nr:dTDP-4-dehydrorhamnose 3,5-epimerase [Symmachiella dynata]